MKQALRNLALGAALVAAPVLANVANATESATKWTSSITQNVRISDAPVIVSASNGVVNATSAYKPLDANAPVNIMFRQSASTNDSISIVAAVSGTLISKTLVGPVAYSTTASSTVVPGGLYSRIWCQSSLLVGSTASAYCQALEANPRAAYPGIGTPQ